jgi:hypothetical protein
VAAILHPLPSHIYEFSGREPFTDDPKYGKQLKLAWGSHNRVILDGKDISDQRITKFKTGNRGYVVCLAFEDNNYIINQTTGHTVRRILQGRVEYFDKRPEANTNN